MNMTLPKFASQPNTVFQRYRFIALAVYSAVFLAGIIDWLDGGLSPAPLFGAPLEFRFYIFVIAMVLLIAIEVLGFGQREFTSKERPKLLPLLLRLGLFGCVVFLAGFQYTRVLFLVIVLYSYFSIGAIFSYAFSILGAGVLIGLNIFYPRFMGLSAPPPLPPPPFPRPSGDLQGMPLGGPVSGGPLSGGPPPPLGRPFPDGPPPGGPMSELPPHAFQPPPNQLPIGGPFGESISSIGLGGFLDANMGSLIALFFTVLLARVMAEALQKQQKLELLNSSLESSHKQLQQYSTQVADLAATEERNRLARDIHDSLGHHLAAINIQLEKADAFHGRDATRVNESVNHAKRSVQDALKDVRESVSSLRDEGEDFSFDSAINELIKRMKHSELDIQFTKIGEDSSYGKLSLMTLYRVVQEGLTNVHKHANATKVQIDVTFDEDIATVVVRDDGKGFEVENWQNSKQQSSFGLNGLQERLSLLGGTLCVKSEIKSGHAQTVLTAKLPKKALYV